MIRSSSGNYSGRYHVQPRAPHRSSDKIFHIVVVQSALFAFIRVNSWLIFAFPANLRVLCVSAVGFRQVCYHPLFPEMPMESPLTPLEFARRARRLYADREAVIDGDLRLTYRQFFDRCDRWSAALLKLGVKQGDRVAYIAPNTHAQLESFYSVLQIGAVLVPINYRLTADDFVYLINHSGSKIICAHSDYLDAIDGIRSLLPNVEAFIALEGAERDNSEGPRGWLGYEKLLSASATDFNRSEIRETDLLTINYTSGTTSKPKGVMITHRNAYLNVIGTLIHHPMSLADRYLWTLPMFHANGWTFVWTVTAAGATHVCLRKVEPVGIFEKIKQEFVSMLCAAPTVLINIANGPEDLILA